MPVFKKDGERSDLGKCHPISLLPILVRSLTKHLDITGHFSDLQYGLCTFRSTADILTVLSKRIYNSLHEGGETRAITLDISKAFNKDWHAGLLHKLKAYGLVAPS